MNGVKITLIATLEPEAVEKWCEAMPEVMKVTATRPGFIDISMYRNASDPCKVLFIETWESEQAYKDYIAWRVERGDAAELQAGVASPSQLEFWSEMVASA